MHVSPAHPKDWAGTTNSQLANSDSVGTQKNFLTTNAIVMHVHGYLVFYKKEHTLGRIYILNKCVKRGRT